MSCRTFCLIGLCCYALVVQSTLASRPLKDRENDLYTWLDKELGMNLDCTTRVDPSRSVTHSGLGKKSEAAEKGPQRNRDLFMSKLRARQDDEALKQLDSVIAAMVSPDAPKYGTYKQRQGELYSVRVDRIFFLKNHNRFVEALIEMQRLKQMIPNGDSRLVKLERLIKVTEQTLVELKEGPSRMFQMKPDETMTKAYRKMMLLLHPDKNANLNSELADYVKHLHELVSDTYEKLSSSRS